MAELHIDVDGKLHITPKALNGVQIAVLGIPGSGKSNTIAVLIEENLPYNTGISILDVHDEYWGLKEKFPFLRVGKNQPFRADAERKSPPVDLELSTSNAAAFAEHVFMKRIPTIVNLRWMSKEQRQEVVLNYTQRLYELNMSYGRPYWVVLEEAHTFIPEGRKTPELEKLVEFAAEGRKLGFTIVLGSQRTAKVDKDVLAMCGYFFLHRVSVPQDVQSYRGLVPAAINKETDFISMLPGQAVVKWSKDGLPQFNIVQIRPQTTFHVGATPDAEELPLPALQTIDMSTLGDLGLKPSAKPQPVTAELSDLSKQLTAAKTKLKYMQRIHLATLTGFLVSRQLVKEKPGAPYLPVIPSPPPALPPLPSYKERTHFNGKPINWEVMTDASVKKQERSFNALLKDVVNGCKYPFHITILKYLVEREDLEMTVPEIARFAGLAEATVRDHPPLYLCVTLALLRRTRIGGVFRYRSSARETLAERFPDLPTDDLIQKLLEV